MLILPLKVETMLQPARIKSLRLFARVPLLRGRLGRNLTPKRKAAAGANVGWTHGAFTIANKIANSSLGPKLFSSPCKNISYTRAPMMLHQVPVWFDGSVVTSEVQYFASPVQNSIT